MKKIWAILPVCLLSLNAFASDFDCVSRDSGIAYETDSEKKVVVLYEPNSNKVINVEPFDTVSVDFIETMPATTVYSYANRYGVFMKVKVKGARITGSFDDDSNLVCVSGRGN